MIVVSNSTPLISLAKIGRFDLLKTIFLLLDERLARQKAKALGLKVIGTLSILLRAKEMRLIEKVKPEMDQLRAQRVRISSKVYEQVLGMAQE